MATASSDRPCRPPSPITASVASSSLRRVRARFSLSFDAGWSVDIPQVRTLRTYLQYVRTDCGSQGNLMDAMSRRELGALALAAGFLGGTSAMADQSGGAMTSANGPLAIDEGRFVDINGMPQWITIRGRDLSNPVLLLLHGGP